MVRQVVDGVFRGVPVPRGKGIAAQDRDEILHIRVVQVLHEHAARPARNTRFVV